MTNKILYILRIKEVIFMIFCLAIISSCVDLFDSGTTSFDDLLFIEAYITDDSDDLPFVKISGVISLAADDSVTVIPEFQDQRFAYAFNDGVFLSKTACRFKRS